MATLTNGKYIITNVAYGDPVGNKGPIPLIKPVVRLTERQIWTVTHVGGNNYLLDIGSFVTLPQGNHIESNGNPTIKGIKWIITQHGSGHYTIIDPQPGHKGWTLRPGVLDVLLDPVPLNGVPPPQLWRFTFFHLLGREEEGEGEEED